MIALELRIPHDFFDTPTTPDLFLATQSGAIIQQLPAYGINLTAKWNSWSELSFSSDMHYVDAITGETKVHPAFDKIEGLRQVVVDQIGRFVIQDPDTSYAEKNSKEVSAFSIEYSLGARYLNNLFINTGEVDSKEVIYLSQLYGESYGMDDDERYQLSTEFFDAYGNYYIREYTDADSYTYAQIQVINEDDYLTYDGSTVEKTLYVKKYENVRFYYPSKPELSLIHIIMQEIPGWEIGNVDVSLWRKERTFSIERQDIYSFLTSDISDTFNCVVSFDTLHQTINFYEEENDGLTEDGVVNPNWETDVYVSRDNLANQINVSYSTDNIKTKLKVSGSDGLDIREINLGQNYIMNLDYYHNLDWMEQDLCEAYDNYCAAVEQYSPLYVDEKQKWVGAYNKWNDLMNAVPAEGNVVLVGDAFEKLYCIYNLYDKVSEYTIENTPMYYIMNSDGSMSVANPQPIEENFGEGTYYVQGDENAIVSALRKRLNLYHVDDDIEGVNNDNILLRLKNSKNDTATIRIYDLKQRDSGRGFDPSLGYYTREQQYAGRYKYTKVYVTEQTYTSSNQWFVNNYRIQVSIVRSSSGIVETPITRTLNQWVRGDLRISNAVNDSGFSMLDGFKVNYIGTLGAYFVLTKDETKKANLSDYGVNLLREKQDTYLTVFQTQTEAMFSQEKYQCIASDTDPLLEMTPPIGTRWLETDISPVVLREYTNSGWKVFNGDLSEYENYTRYKDNYDKLKAVQEVLIEKEKVVEYCLNGYPVNTRTIDINKYTHGVGQSLEGDMYRAAQEHFLNNESIARVNMDESIPLYTFRTSAYPSETFAVYLKGKTPYVAYASSQGVHQAKMNYYAKLTELQSFFNEDQWIRFLPLIREDEYTDDNFFLTGYESEEERMEISKQLLKEAEKELKSLSRPSLEFSMSMTNLLALPEFAPIVNQFALGNFIRVELRPNVIKRTRLLEVQIDFDNLSSANCSFGNLVTTKSEIDLHAELLQNAIQAGKTVAQSAGNWQRAVDKSNAVEQTINDGLSNATLEIGKANQQNIQWGEHGIWCRKKIDGTEDQYEDEQIRIINNKILYSNDNFKTSKSAFGSFTYNGKTYSGVLADALVGGLVSGSHIEGGSLSIGGESGRFVVNEDGSCQILGPDNSEIYANKTQVDILNDAVKFQVELQYSDPTVFSQINSTCRLTAHVYSLGKDITSRVLASGAKFNWIRTSNGDDTTWNASHANYTTNTLVIGNSDVEGNGQISVQVVFDDNI